MKKYRSNALAQPYVGPGNSYGQNARIVGKDPTDANLGSFQAQYGEVSPGVPETGAQRQANMQGDAFGPPMNSDQMSLMQMVQDFEAEFGQGATMEVLSLIRKDAIQQLEMRGNGQDLAAEPMYQQYQKLRGQ